MLKANALPSASPSISRIGRFAVSESVYVTEQGDCYHTNCACPGIRAGHSGATAQGSTVYEPEPVSLSSAKERGLKACEFVGGCGRQA